MLKKAQSSTEYILLLTIVIIIVLIVYSSLYKIPLVFTNFNEKSQIDYWRTAEVGVYSGILNSNNTILYIINNHRIPINLTEIYINNISLEISPSIINSSQIQKFTSSKVFLISDYGLSFNYSFGNDSIFFNGNSLLFPFSGS